MRLHTQRNVEVQYGYMLLLLVSCSELQRRKLCSLVNACARNTDDYKCKRDLTRVSGQTMTSTVGWRQTTTTGSVACLVYKGRKPNLYCRGRWQIYVQEKEAAFC